MSPLWVPFLLFWRWSSCRTERHNPFGDLFFNASLDALSVVTSVSFAPQSRGRKFAMPDLTERIKRLELYVEQLLIHLRSMPRRSAEATLVRLTIKQMMQRRREYLGSNIER